MNSPVTPTRRQFLSLAGGTVLSTPLLSSCQAEAESPGTGCPIGFGTYGLPGYSLTDAIKFVSETGFNSVEIVTIAGYHGDPAEVSAAVRKDARKMIADLGIRLGALMGLPHPAKDPAGQKKNLEAVKEVVQLAHDLAPDSPPLVQTVLGSGKWEDVKTLYRDTLGSWLEVTTEGGIHLCIKPHRGHAMSIPEEGIWLIEELDAKRKMSLVFDFSHYAFRDMPVEDTVAVALPFTGYLVMKDAVEEENGKVRFQLPGESGAMPHAQVLRKFYEGGYRGEVCCEVSSQVSKAEGYDPVAATKTCYQNLEAIFAEAKVPRISA